MKRPARLAARGRRRAIQCSGPGPGQHWAPTEGRRPMRLTESTLRCPRVRGSRVVHILAVQTPQCDTRWAVGELPLLCAANSVQGSGSVPFEAIQPDRRANRNAGRPMRSHCVALLFAATCRCALLQRRVPCVLCARGRDNDGRNVFRYEPIAGRPRTPLELDY